MTAYRYTKTASPIGELGIVADADGRLVEIVFHADRQEPVSLDERDEIVEDTGEGSGHPGSAEIVRQLDEYFAGRRRGFDLELAPRGTDFQLRVWRALAEIPYGETVSYADIAERLGRPGAARAVGRANGTNPIPIVVPCHRVIGADGSLTGYGGGLPIKRALLELEGWRPAAVQLPLAAAG